MSFGNTTTNSTTATQGQAQTNPWGPSIPYLTNFLQDANAATSQLGPSKDQLDAFAQLKNNVSQGNPFTPQITSLANDQFNTQSQAPAAQDALKTLQSNLGDYASGKMLDFNSNPYVQQMLKTVGDDTQNRINQMFAGSGRDMSGYNQQDLSRGLAQGEAPILSQLYTTEQGNQLNAAGQLYNAGAGTASETQQLDQAAQAARAAGINTGNQAINAQNYAPNQVLNLDQQLKQMPLNDLSLYASLLLPTAGLGGSQASNSTSNTSGSQNTFGVKL